MVEQTLRLSEINHEAPVVGASEIQIAAAPEAAWQVLTAVEGWPSWNPAVRFASLQGGVEEGSTFRWKAGSGTIRSTIEDVEKPWRIAWTGSALGVKAIHIHTFEPRAGGTFVRTEESLDGPIARLFRGRLQATLDDALESELRCLKAEVERRER